MNSLDFGSSLPSSGTNYLRAKQKGDTVNFRIAQNPVYSGKHFSQSATGWDITSCPRINNQEECDTCELFFAGIAESKKLKESDPEKAKQVKKEADKNSVSIAFYFPILNRDTKQFNILQVTQGVRNKINAAYEAGTKVIDKDWVLRNTGSANPGEVYFIQPIDSADTKPLDAEDKAEYKKAKEFDMDSLSDGSSNSDEIEE